MEAVRKGKHHRNTSFVENTTNRSTEALMQGIGRVRKGKEAKFRQQSHANMGVTLDPSSPPVSVEVRLLWEGAT